MNSKRWRSGPDQPGPARRYRQRETTGATPVHVEPLWYPPTQPFPTHITDSFPALPYETRRGQIKSAIHWGQRKLLLSEVQLLIEALEACGRECKFHIVYAGAAPGEHLAFLDGMFPGHTWELIDPIAFHPSLLRLPNFLFRNKYFTNESAYAMSAERLVAARCPALGALLHSHYFSSETSEGKEEDNTFRSAKEGANLIEGVEAVAQPPLPSPPPGILVLFQSAMRRVPQLFVCDIRSGSVTQHSAEDAEENELPVLPSNSPTPFELFERHVADDMAAQQTWVELLQPTFSLLKFRLPYMEVSHPITKEIVYRHHSETTLYLGGKVLLPIWARPSTTECRLLVPQGAFRILYNNKKYEDQCFFFNTVLRERVHFQHALGENAPKRSCLDHRYDGTAEVQWLTRYILLDLGVQTEKLRLLAESGAQESTEPPSVLDEASSILELSELISISLHKSFKHAAERLDHVRMEKAKQRGFSEAEQNLQQRTLAYRSADVWWRNDQPQNKNSDSSWEFCKKLV